MPSARYEPEAHREWFLYYPATGEVQPLPLKSHASSEKDSRQAAITVGYRPTPTAAPPEAPLTPEQVEAVWADFHQTREVMMKHHGTPDTHGPGPTLRHDEDESSQRDLHDPKNFPRYCLMVDTGRPARWLEPDGDFEWLAPSGKWEPLDIERFAEETEEVDRARFDEAVREFGGKG